MFVRKFTKGGDDVVVTIGHKYGCGGREIAWQLARRLNVPCRDADPFAGGECPEPLKNLAARGSCVVTGFCADHLLAGTEGLIRVFLHGAPDRRAERIARQSGLTMEEARREALSRDREWARRYGVYTGGKWAEASRYDLTVDSTALGVAGTVELLSQFIALKVMRRRGGEG